MWPDSYESRLLAWRSLRDSVIPLDTPQQLSQINDWWWRAPMINRDIDWYRTDLWPDPWQLLQQDGYSDLARALGIVYTLLMVQADYAERTRLVADADNNLVLVDDGKYILNWGPDQILNIRSQPISIIREVSVHELHTKTGEQ